MGFAGAMMVAMVADALLGWSNRLFARIGHPVTWLGRLIAALDAQWNRETDASSTRRVAGIAAALFAIALAAGIGWIVEYVIPLSWTGTVLLGILAWPFVAFRSLYDHVAAVRDPLRAGDIEAARRKVAMIVSANIATCVPIEPRVAGPSARKNARMSSSR